MVVAEVYDRLKDWALVQKSLMDNNLLNKVKLETFKREFREIKKRISLVTTDQLHILIHGGLDDAKAIILLSLAKAYPFFRDFVIEVIRSKYLIFDRVMTETDYTKFFNTKRLSHKELEVITEVTAKKVKQRFFTLLRQVGLITTNGDGAILRPFLSNRVLEVIIEDNPSYLIVFMISDEEIKSLLQKMKHAQKSAI